MTQEKKDFDYFYNVINSDNLSVVADQTCQMYRTQKSNLGVIVSKTLQNEIKSVMIPVRGCVSIFENEQAKQLAKLCEARASTITQKNIRKSRNNGR
ncbi:MAG: hypothetical protein MJ158_04465 [Alphaproteobacteria bacterium]|nr:hypothetical protein [Alphaproteobacteria bacterium]